MTVNDLHLEGGTHKDLDDSQDHVYNPRVSKHINYYTSQLCVAAASGANEAVSPGAQNLRHGGNTSTVFPRTHVYVTIGAVTANS